MSSECLLLLLGFQVEIRILATSCTKSNKSEKEKEVSKATSKNARKNTDEWIF